MSNTPGQRVRDLRKAQGLTQQQLGDMVGVSKNSVSMIETGSMKISTGLAPKLAEALGVSTDHIFGISPSENEDLLVAITALQPDEQEAIRLLVRRLAEKGD